MTHGNPRRRALPGREPGEIPDPEAVDAYIEEMRAEAEAALGRFTGILGENQDKTYEGHDPGGLVSATVDALGELAGIDVSDDALWDVNSLGARIMAAIAEARLAQSSAMMDGLAAFGGGRFDLVERFNAAIPQDTRETLKQYRNEY